jgi:hypothetical protein
MGKGCGHPCRCDSYRDHILSISVSSAAMPTRRPEANATNAKEARWHQDMPAYKRLRKNGVQPKSIDGAARIEAHANEQIEVETGLLRTDVPE